MIALDTRALFERIKDRKPSYMEVFSSRRTRDHFSEIFVNRYYSLPVDALIEVPQNIMENIDKFYRTADDIKWYLMTTQDMPNTIEEKLNIMIRDLENHFLELKSQIETIKNTEFSRHEETEMMIPSIPPKEYSTE